MVYAVKRFRLKMLGWLFLPALLIIFLSAQLVKTVETFATQLHDKTKQEQVAEGDIPTAILEIPPFVYKNTGLVTFWFDDAWESQYSIGLPALEKYNFNAALAVPTKAVETYGYMTWLQIKRIQHKGWEITSHSQSHNCSMQNAKQDLVNSEVLGSQVILRSKGLRSDIYVTPCGVGSPLINQTVRKAYPLGLRTSDDTDLNPIPMPYSYDLNIMAVTDKTTKKDVQGWLARAKAQRKWLIIVFHRLDNPKEEYDTDEKHFDDIVEAVHESGLPVVLPTQVLRIPGTGKLKPPVYVDTPDVPDVLDEGFTDDSYDDSSDTSDSTPTPTPRPTTTPSVTPTPSVILTITPNPSPTSTASGSAN